jgi:hypothetical protein
MTYERWRLTISSRGVGDVFATLAAMVSRISDGKVVMFTLLVLWLSIAIRRNAERRGCVSREKRVCKPREEMPMQGRCEEEVVLAGAIIEVGVVDVSGE